jgi:SPP1 family phage portal protein
MATPITNIPSDMFSGRNILRTDLTTLSADALKKDLERLLPSHTYNRQQIRALQEYLKGWHPAIQERVKTTRTDVDNKITVNYAWSITRDITGYFLGKPIQYTNREGKRRKQMENLVGVLSAENKALVDFQIASDCSICGVGYRGIFNENSARNGTHLKLLRLEPQDTFVVYPSDPTKPSAYAVTAYDTQEENGSSRYYKVYTPSSMVVFKDVTVNGNDAMTGANLELVEETPINFGGGLPIVEYRNNLWLMGDWEMAISVMDALDIVASDGVNDIQQAVNSVLVVLGAKMDETVFAQLSEHGFLAISEIPPGVKPEIKFISEAMSADVGIAMRDYLEATLRVIVGVPDRKTRGGGGGDTGDAVFMRDGWQDIDLVATAKEPYFIQSEREALTVILYVLDTHKEVAGVKATDIDIHFNRNKTANLQSKAQVYQTLTSGEASLAPADALDIAGLTNNVHDVIMRSESYHKDMQKNSLSDGKESKSKSDSSEDDKLTAGDEGDTA